MQLTNNKILITGGATGIGLGLAGRFIEEGNTVLICGRRQEALDEAKAALPGLITFQCDLEDEAGRTRLYDWVAEAHSDLTVLVNNAGIQNWMDLTDEAFYAKAAGEISINIAAPLQLTQLFLSLPQLTTIMNVSSGLAFIPLAKVPVYSATKAFMRSFTLSLRHLLKGSKEVIEIIPPALNTDLGQPGLHAEYPPVNDFIESIFAQLKEGKQELTFGTSAARAEANNAGIMDYFNRMNGVW